MYSNKTKKGCESKYNFVNNFLLICYLFYYFLIIINTIFKIKKFKTK